MGKYIHGGKGTRIYSIWKDMNRRTKDENRLAYKNYGGRGIKVCESWSSNFSVFREWAFSNGYKDELTIERKDVNGDYSPENCEWIPKSRQMRNTRININITAFGETKIARDWANDSRCIVAYMSLIGRINSGWSPEDAITIPSQNKNGRKNTVCLYEAFGEKKRLTDWINDERCPSKNYRLVSVRIHEGWEVERAISTPTLDKTKVKNRFITAWNEIKSLNDWMKDDRCVITNKFVILSRLNSYGWSPEEAFSIPSRERRK